MPKIPRQFWHKAAVILMCSAAGGTAGWAMTLLLALNPAILGCMGILAGVACGYKTINTLLSMRFGS